MRDIYWRWIHQYGLPTDDEFTNDSVLSTDSEFAND